jgi:hypothetical protein
MLNGCGRAAGFLNGRATGGDVTAFAVHQDAVLWRWARMPEMRLDDRRGREGAEPVHGPLLSLVGLAFCRDVIHLVCWWADGVPGRSRWTWTRGPRAKRCDPRSVERGGTAPAGVRRTFQMLFDHSSAQGWKKRRASRRIFQRLNLADSNWRLRIMCKNGCQATPGRCWRYLDRTNYRYRWCMSIWHKGARSCRR